jgi:hypothetical protein
MNCRTGTAEAAEAAWTALKMGLLRSPRLP